MLNLVPDNHEPPLAEDDSRTTADDSRFVEAITSWSKEAPEIRRQTPLLIVLLLLFVTFAGIEGLEVACGLLFIWYMGLRIYHRKLINNFDTVFRDQTELLCRIKLYEDPNDYGPTAEVVESATGSELGLFRLLVPSDQADALAGSYNTQFERYVKFGMHGKHGYLIIFDRHYTLCAITRK